MSDPVLDLQGALLTYLRGQASLQVRLGSPVRIYDELPEQVTYPYVTFGRTSAQGIGGVGPDVTGSGVFRDASSDALMRDVFFSQTPRAWQIIVPDFGTFSGSFLIAALEYAGQHDGEATFSLSLASAGEVSFAAA